VWVELSIAIGALAGATAGFSLRVSYRALRAPSEANGELLRAFKALESDFSDQEDRVRSALGRISRLKREILPARDAENGGAEIPQGATPPPPTGRPLTRSQLLARSHQKGGTNYGVFTVEPSSDAGRRDE